MISTSQARKLSQEIYVYILIFQQQTHTDVPGWKQGCLLQAHGIGAALHFLEPTWPCPALSTCNLFKQLHSLIASLKNMNVSDLSRPHVQTSANPPFLKISIQTFRIHLILQKNCSFSPESSPKISSEKQNLPNQPQSIPDCVSVLLFFRKQSTTLVFQSWFFLSSDSALGDMQKIHRQLRRERTFQYMSWFLVEQTLRHNMYTTNCWKTLPGTNKPKILLESMIFRLSRLVGYVSVTPGGIIGKISSLRALFQAIDLPKVVI